MLYCCSLYRPLTEEPEDAVGCMREIEYYSRLRTQGIVNTSNLGEETTAGLIRGVDPVGGEDIRAFGSAGRSDGLADKRFGRGTRRHFRVSSRREENATKAL